ncbi:PREDICTED: LOW QUALITY PROTEIN: probable F-box protein At3g25550, partial [Camelina sativa]|uniref:LOW QUALITY PROTEIN: probable F-box protein At3g25550 n=1 Tax=Camelina sativa TaxID=90675 RepID=A0ABM0Y986_CAMSA
MMHHGRELRESKKRRREVNEILNNDILEEIMVRLPVKTLIRFQTVSKQWRRMITSRSLKERYSFALKTMSLEWSSTCLVEEEEEYHISNEHEERILLVSESLDGIFCLCSGTDFIRPIKLINPATRWSWTLPLAKIQIEHSPDNNKVDFPRSGFGKDRPGFGKDYVTGTYK